MIKDRVLFAERAENISVPTNLVNALSRDGLGQKRKKYAFYKNSVSIIPDSEKLNPQKLAPVGAGWFHLKKQINLLLRHSCSFSTIRRVWGIPNFCIE